MSWGPFAPNLEPGERMARLRAVRALAGVFCHRCPEFAAALLAAERDPTALGGAEAVFERIVPTLNRRKLLASYADLARAG
jgi:hypothetical protein